jgi:hypothetical protein
LVLIPADGGWLSHFNYVNQMLNPAFPQNEIPSFFSNQDWISVAVELDMGGLSNGYGFSQFQSLVDWYDLYRSTFDAAAVYGPSFPICVWGGSSAGHLALMLAIARSSVDCVLTEAGPTSITGIYNLCVAQPSANYCATTLYAGFAFGAVSTWGAWNPVSYPHPSYFQMPTLLGNAKGDSWIPFGQATSFASTRPASSSLVLLPPGTGNPTCTSQCYFTGHGAPVGATSIGQWRSSMAALLP